MTTATDAPPARPAPVSGDLPLLDRVPDGASRTVIDAIAEELGSAVLSELTWADPPVLGLRPGPPRPVARVTRVVLGDSDGVAHRSFAYVERPDGGDGVVVGANESYPVSGSLVRHVARVRSGATTELRSLARDLLREAVRAVVFANPYLPAPGPPASSESVAELTRLVLGRDETLRALTRLTGHPVDELPVLLGEPSRSVVGAESVVARHLAFARDLASGAPEEWAARRFEGRS